MTHDKKVTVGNRGKNASCRWPFRHKRPRNKMGGTPITRPIADMTSNCDDGLMDRDIEVGRFAPYPIWLGMTVMARGAQLVFLSFCVWALVGLFDAMDKSSTTPFPPIWLWAIAAFLGCCPSHWRGRTSPVGDAIGNKLASQHCPACGQNIFDRSSGHGYAPPLQRQRMFPSRCCANCGQDLKERVAS